MTPTQQLFCSFWPSGDLTRTSLQLHFSQLLWLDAALVNKVAPCVRLSSSALEVLSLRLRLRVLPDAVLSPAWCNEQVAVYALDWYLYIKLQLHWSDSVRAPLLLCTAHDEHPHLAWGCIDESSNDIKWYREADYIIMPLQNISWHNRSHVISRYVMSYDANEKNRWKRCIFRSSGDVSHGIYSNIRSHVAKGFMTYSLLCCQGFR